jgi:DNA repair protein RadA/Sms
MKKKSRGFVCTVCGHKSPVKLGKCPECESWNSFVEVEVEEEIDGDINLLSINAPSVKLSESRVQTGIEEFDRVLGGGIVKGSITLVGGEPGIGKSTLLLQVAGTISEDKKAKILYVSGEESYFQIRMRAERLNIRSDNLLILTEQDVIKVRDVILRENPQLVIVDSIQAMNMSEIEGSAGNVAQVKECTRVLTEVAKKHGIPIILVGHVTKEGTIAGPKTIEHIVDGVFYVEGSRNDIMRFFRSVKNRFGTTNEAGLFEMREQGLIGVKDPMLEFVTENNTLPLGSVITASLEGSLPLFFEVQSLVTPTVFPIPRRVASGVEYNRLLVIIAILEKSLKVKLGTFDIYANTVGGFKTDDRSMDLALAMAIMSSYLEKEVPAKTVIMGEPGLAGEVRPTVGIERKIIQGVRLGFETFLIPSFFRGKIKIPKASILYASSVKEAREILF